MDISKVLSKFDHNAGKFQDALGISNHELLQETVLKWMKETGQHSRAVQIILDHATLNDNEKIYCLVELGKMIVIGDRLNGLMNMEESL